MLFRASVRAVIENSAGEALLVRHVYGGRSWALPGGGLERGESVAEAVVRECREELGLAVTPVRVTGVYTKAGSPELVVVFACEAAPGEPLPGPEISECRYFPLESPPPGLGASIKSRISDARGGGAPVCRLEP